VDAELSSHEPGFHRLPDSVEDEVDRCQFQGEPGVSLQEVPCDPGYEQEGGSQDRRGFQHAGEEADGERVPDSQGGEGKGGDGG